MHKINALFKPLFIRSAKVSDAGTYQYIAEDMTCTGQLHIEELTIDQGLSGFSVALGREAQFTVMLSCASEGQWFHNGKPISDPACEITQDGTLHNLRIASVEVNHLGAYSFQAGSKLTSCELSLADGDFLRELIKEKHAYAGAKIMLDCELAREFPEADGIWLYENRQIQPGNGISMYNEGNLRRLFIESAHPEMTGIVTYAVGHSQTSTRLIVSPLEISSSVTDVNATSQHRAIIEVQFTHEISLGDEGWWFKDDEALSESDERVQMISDGRWQKVVIQPCQPNDAGMYSFRAPGVEYTSQLFVEVLQIDQPLKATTLNESHQATFDIVMSAPTSGNWFHKGEQIRESEKYAIETTDSRHHTLIVKHLTEQDTGMVEFVTSTGEKSVAPLKVNPVQIINQIAETKVQVNNEATFECEVSVDDCMPVWTKNNKKLNDGEKYQMKSEGRKHFLTVRRVNVTDQGDYTCSVGSKQCTAPLFVEPTVGDSCVVVRTTDSTVVVAENGEALLEFETSQDNIHGQWYKDGEEFDDNKHEHVKYVVHARRHKLLFKEVGVSDAGEYVFTTGSETASVMLEVQAAEMEDEPTIEPAMHPTFVQELRSQVSEVGQQVFVTCRVKGAPAPSVFWFKNGQQIASDGQKYMISQESDQHTLIINNCDMVDNAVYTAVSENHVGRVETAAEVVVRDGSVQAPSPKPRSPQFSQQAQPVEIIEGLKEFVTREGQSAVFSAKVAGNNYQAFWFQNSKQIEQSKFFQISEYQGIHQLKITEVFPEDAGQYRLVIKGQKSEVSTAAVLKLDSKYEFWCKKHMFFGSFYFYNDLTLFIYFLELFASPTPQAVQQTQSGMEQAQPRQPIQLPTVGVPSAEQPMNVTQQNLEFQPSK